MSSNTKEKSRPSTGAAPIQRKAKAKKEKADLQTKEEEYRCEKYLNVICWYLNYRRLNEELESKAASLLREADDILVLILSV